MVSGVLTVVAEVRTMPKIRRHGKSLHI